MKDWRIKGALRRKLAALLIVVLVLGMMPGSGVAVLAEDGEQTGKTDLSGAIVEVNKSYTYTYTGQPVTLSEDAISVSLNDELIDSEQYTIEYSNNIDAGTASAIIKAKEDSDYIGTVSGTFIINKAIPNIGMVTANELENTLDVSKVELNRIDTTVEGTLKLRDKTDLIYGEHTYNWEFKPEDEDNYMVTSGAVKINVKDTISPTAIYQIGGGQEKPFIEWNESSTSDSLCKIDTEVTITAMDDTETVSGSGIAQIKYAIVNSDEEISDTNQITSWEEYKDTNKILLNTTGSSIIYVKVVDKAGNIAILKSEKIIVYEKSSVSPSALDYKYKANTDQAVELMMNGNAFKELLDWEENIINDTKYNIDEKTGILTLKASYLDTLNTGSYTYTVKMKPQGVDTEEELIKCTFTVNVTARKLTVKNAKAENRMYNGKTEIKITNVELEGIADEDKDKVSIDGNKVKGNLNSPNAGIYKIVNLSELVLTGSAVGNYSLDKMAENVPVDVEIEKADYKVDVQKRSYLSSKEKQDSIDLTSLFPKNYETVTYGAITTSGSITYSVEPSTNAGKLSYTVNSGKPEDTGRISILIETQNYKNFSIIIELKLTEKMPVSLKEGDSLLVKDTMTYGEPLSSLTFQKVTFVDEDGNPVEGSIAWETPEKVPTVAEETATWKFQPKNSDDYETAMGTVKITVEKAIPYIVTLPIANTITYGDTLSASDLSGGSVKHGNGKGEEGNGGLSDSAIKGSFKWKDNAIAPKVADSGKTEYMVIFTPSDSDAMNYAEAECKVTLTVNKAAYPPNKPDDTMDATNYDKVGDVPLLDGWKWKEEDKDTSLTEGAKVTAEAYYTGDDRENYEHETITITLTKLSGGNPTNPITPTYPTGIHQHVYSSKITKDPSCTEKGIRTYSCPCGASYTEELASLDGHRYTSKVTKQPTATAEGIRTYTCDRCQSSYTEKIAKLDSEKEEKPDPSELTVSKTTLEKNALTMNTKLTVGQIGSKIYVAWGKVSGADGYDVYVQYCGTDFSTKPSGSVKGTERAKVAISQVDGKKLDLKKNYKVYVAAYKLVGGEKVSLGKTITAHGIGRENKTYTNAREIELKKDSYSLKSGGTATISASTVLDDKNKKQLSDAHAKEFRYASSNKKVATVSAAGKIKAVGEGSCTIYVYSRNGYAETIKVTVK